MRETSVAVAAPAAGSPGNACAECICSDGKWDIHGRERGYLVEICRGCEFRSLPDVADTRVRIAVQGGREDEV